MKKPQQIQTLVSHERMTREEVRCLREEARKQAESKKPKVIVTKPKDLPGK